MSFPPSRRNQLSEYYSSIGLVNYDLRSPLGVPPDFFTFPCKGFPKGPSVVTFDTNEIKVTLEGTAVHGGGHCQFGISYDDRNFVVLKTVLTNCLLDSMSYSFQIPEDTRGKGVTVFWTWINRIGNREYYMECTDVTVNTDGNRTDIRGKELLIVNQPGYPTVPEWEVGAPSYIDGRDLLAARRDIVLGSVATNTSVSNRKIVKNKIIKHIYVKTKTHKVNTKNEQTDDKQTENETHNCDCVDGDMKCNGLGFDTCVGKEWVYRSCSSGTSCKKNANSVICDYE
jgi:hypothetical protein